MGRIHLGGKEREERVPGGKKKGGRLKRSGAQGSAMQKKIPERGKDQVHMVPRKRRPGGMLTRRVPGTTGQRDKGMKEKNRRRFEGILIQR